MSLVEHVLVLLLALGLARSRWLAALWEGRAEMARTHFRKEVIRQWVEKMPKEGRVITDCWCPDNTVYCINPNLERYEPIFGKIQAGQWPPVKR